MKPTFAGSEFESYFPNQKLLAIKYVRQKTNLGLYDSKMYVDKFFELNNGAFYGPNIYPTFEEAKKIAPNGNWAEFYNRKTPKLSKTYHFVTINNQAIDIDNLTDSAAQRINEILTSHESFV